MFKRAWPYVLGLYSFSKSKFYLNLSLLLLSGLFSGIGLLVFLPIISVLNLGSGLSGLDSGLSEKINLAFNYLNLPISLLTCLSLFLTIIFLNSCLKYFHSTFSSGYQQEFIKDLRVKLYAKIIKANTLFHVKISRSKLIHSLTTEVQQISAVTHFFMRIVSDFVLGFIYFFMSVLISPLLTLGALGFAGTIFYLLRNQNKKAIKTGAKTHASNQELHHQMTDQLSAISLTKIFGQEESHIEKIEGLSSQIISERLEFAKQQARNNFYYGIGGAFFFSLFFYVSFSYLAMPLSESILLLVVFSRLYPRASSIQQNFQRMLNLLPAFETLEKIKREAEVVQEHLKPPNLLVFKKEIQLKNISFTYEQSQGNLVLENINLDIQKNKFIAFIGESGGGKSTLCQIIAGLFKPDLGNIIIDNQTLDQHNLRAWRGKIAYVPQENFLFNDTIKNNLLWAKPDATQDDLWAALKLASAAKFVTYLPQGINTVVGDRGMRLSGGEQQRIAIARALLKNPEVLILDEATSFLDNKNEKNIQEAIKNLQGKLTLIVIAHRLSTIRNADKVYEIENGKMKLEQKPSRRTPIGYDSGSGEQERIFEK